MSSASLDRPFEFVLVDAPALRVRCLWPTSRAREHQDRELVHWCFVRHYPPLHHAAQGLRPDPEPFVEKMAEAASVSLGTPSVRMQSELFLSLAACRRTQESSVISFENLGRDALLVVPQCAAGHKTGHRSTRAPTCEGWQPAEGAPYAHIADFMRGAPSEQARSASICVTSSCTACHKC